MRLYTYPRAPNPRRVHVYLAEKGIELECVPVDIMKRENRTPEFLEKVNVMGGVPVLELDDGSHVAESVAICRYLEALHPEPPLFGADPRSRASVDMWLRRLELNFMVPLGQAWIHGSPFTRSVNPHQIAEAAKLGRTLVRRYYAFLDAQLAERAFVAGDAFSMADIVCVCTVDFATGLNELPPDPELGHLARWHREVSERPSVAGS